MLNNCPNLYKDLWANKGLSKRLMNRINPTKGPSRVVEAFNNLANNKKVDEAGHSFETIPAQFKKAFEEYDIDKIEYLSSKFQGYFVANFSDLLSNTIQNNKELGFVLSKNQIKQDAVDLFCRLLDKVEKVPVADLLKLNEYIKNNDNYVYKVIQNTQGTSKMIENQSKLVLTNEQKMQIETAIKTTIQKEIQGSTPLGKVYIDPTLKNHKIPTRKIRSASDNAVLTPGTKVYGEKDNNLKLFGIYWKDGKNGRGDIDLSVNLLKENYETVDHCYYWNLKTIAAIHSGDYTSAPNGAVEMIVLDKEKMRENDIRYAVVNVHGFNVPFSQADNLRFIQMERNGSIDETVLTKNERNYGEVIIDGKLFEPLLVKNPIALTQNSTQCSPVVYDVKEDCFIWLDNTRELNTFTPCDNIANIESMNQNTKDLYKALHNFIPNMYDMFEQYGIAAGEMVDSPELADTLFLSKNIDTEKSQLKEDVKVYTSQDLSVIMNDFCGIPKKIDVPEEPQKEITLNLEKVIDTPVL